MCGQCWSAVLQVRKVQHLGSYAIALLGHLRIELNENINPSMQLTSLKLKPIQKIRAKKDLFCVVILRMIVPQPNYGSYSLKTLTALFCEVMNSKANLINLIKLAMKVIEVLCFNAGQDFTITMKTE